MKYFKKNQAQDAKNASLEIKKQPSLNESD
jgi:hypothetical protein